MSANPQLVQIDAGRPRTHAVALVGSPNSGKSTLFNTLTGLRQKVANYPGVTVESHLGRVRFDDGREVPIIDLPGIYSLEPVSEDERVTHDVLTGRMPEIATVSAILLIVDATNLARNLALAAPILSLKLPTLIVLNMADDLRGRGGTVDVAQLEAELGVPVALTTATTGEGVDKVRAFLGQRAIPAPKWAPLPVLQDVPACRRWAAQMGERCGYRAPAPPLWTRRLDRAFLHPVWGALIFLAVTLLVFQSIFTWAEPAMEAIKSLIAGGGQWIEATLPASALRSLLIEGVLGGVGAVVVFLPQILLLFLFIGLLEDSGYLARAALIADRTLGRVGLQGKSFIPLLSAHACAVPAILATRIIENKRDRIATILIAPLMTCAARLPIYTLIIGAFIPEREVLGPIGTRAVALIGLYLLSFLAAIATARVLKSTVLKSEASPFVLEMPPYRWPTWRTVGYRLYDRALAFLTRAGTVILVMTVVFWLLAHLPMRNGQPVPIEESIAGQVGHAVEPLIRPLGFNWRIGVGILSCVFGAREMMVSTLGTIYQTEQDEESPDLRSRVRQDLTLGGAWALLVFFAFAMQCASTVSVVRRETGGWGWAVAQFVYMTVLAYVGGYAANRLVTWIS
ncbi:MAG: ferrous iron transporter B [Bryobacteraceae bacterium]|nr:ferrous iron transporter B [Bryobacteraceae bacterium]